MRHRPRLDLRSASVVSPRAMRRAGEGVHVEDAQPGLMRGAGPASATMIVPVLQWEYTEWILECRVESLVEAGEECGA